MISHAPVPKELWRLYPRCLYGNKARPVTTAKGVVTLAEAVAHEFGPGVTRVAETCAGTSFCGWVFKWLGYTTTSIDIRPAAVLRAKALVENSATKLTEAEIDSVVSAQGEGDGTFVRRYTDTVGPTNARFLDRLRAGLTSFVDPMKRAVAASAAMAVLERTRPIPHFHVSRAGGLCKPGLVKEVNFALEWRNFLLVDLPRLLVDNATTCRAFRGDAVESAANLEVQAIYADFPYGASYSSYETSYAMLDDWAELLLGEKAEPIRHRRLGSASGCMPSIWGLLHAARHVPTVIISYNDCSGISPERIGELAERIGREVVIRRYRVTRPTTEKGSPNATCDECLIVCRSKGKPVRPPKTRIVAPPGSATKRSYVWHPALRLAIDSFPAPEGNPGQGMRMIDLFAGTGGFRIAAESLGMQCVFASELNCEARHVYKYNFGHWPEGDITKVDAAAVPDHDLLTGGAPCQSWSHSGNLGGFSDPRGMLFYEIVRILRAKQPRMFLLENVRNFSQFDQGRAIRRALAELTDAGYVVHHDVLDAVRYAVPQCRARTFLVGFRKDQDADFSFPEPIDLLVPLKDVMEHGPHADRLILKFKVQFRDIGAALRKARKNPLAHVRIGQFRGGAQGQRVFHSRGPAATLCVYGQGCYSTQSYLIDGKVRSLTPRECARVQGYPENFVIPFSGEVAEHCFGNAIPVPVVRAIMVRMLEANTKRAAVAA